MPQADRDATRRAFSKPAAFVLLIEGLTLKTELTAARLRELLHYDPETGVFTRRMPGAGRGGPVRYPAGSAVGSKTALGYLETEVVKVRCLLHRLAVLYMTGEWPVDQVDHINGQRSDNRWANLRQVDNTTNIENRWRANKNNRSGVLGAHFNAAKGKWAAQVTVMRRGIHVGYFDTPEAAHAAYVAKKRQVHRGNTL